MTSPTPAREQFPDTPPTERLQSLVAAVEQLSAAALAASQDKERIDRMQSQFVQAARLTEMDQMVSAFAHELNQPLAAASNYLRAAKRFHETGADPRRIPELIEKAEAQFTRASEIVKRIRGLAGRKEPTKTAQTPASLIGEAIELALLDPRHGGIELVLDVPRDLPPVMADRLQIQQVLFNLLRNAFDAVAANETREIIVRAARVSGMIEMSVADNGAGLAPEIAAKLFQPFVTGKEDGMGLGLCICRTIVEAHGGQIWSESEPGRGAVFRFTLQPGE